MSTRSPIRLEQVLADVTIAGAPTLEATVTRASPTISIGQAYAAPDVPGGGVCSLAMGITAQDVDNGAGFFQAIRCQVDFGGDGHKGGVNIIEAQGFHNSPTHPDNPNRNYVGVYGEMRGVGGDGGTAPNRKDARGAVYGGGFYGTVLQKNYFNVTGAEFNVSIEDGASAAVKTGIQVITHTLDRGHGSELDCAIAIGAQPNAQQSMNGIVFTDMYGENAIHPTEGTVLAGVGSAVNCKYGIDFANFVFAGDAFRSQNNARITAGGAITGIGNTTNVSDFPSQVGWAICDNVSFGAGEVVVLNTYEEAEISFAVRQKTGENTSEALFEVLPDGTAIAFKLRLNNLPTADPGESGAVYNNGGVLMISSGPVEGPAE